MRTIKAQRSNTHDFTRAAAIISRCIRRTCRTCRETVTQCRAYSQEAMAKTRSRLKWWTGRWCIAWKTLPPLRSAQPILHAVCIHPPKWPHLYSYSYVVTQQQLYQECGNISNWSIKFAKRFVSIVRQRRRHFFPHHREILSMSVFIFSLRVYAPAVHGYLRSFRASNCHHTRTLVSSAGSPSS